VRNRAEASSNPKSGGAHQTVTVEALGGLAPDKWTLWIIMKNKLSRGFMNARLAAMLLLVLPALFGQDPLSKAEELYRQTEYKTSLAIVAEVARPSAAAYCLAGKDYFMLGDYNKATEAFRKALALEPGKSEYAHWLGKSFGRRAETSSPFLAPMHASKARAYFEKAVALDPNNDEALSDLFDYYLEAPGFLGGGYDKAEAIARRIEERNPAEGHFAESQLADKRKQFDTAEEHLRRAMELAPRQVGRVLDLARYLAKRGRIQESEAAFDKAEQLAPDSPKVSFARASVYIEQKRNLDRARVLLKKYLGSNLTPDDPPREQAKKLLQEASGA
jgi:tetratricopeptide (TPR) repeat protein